MSRVPVPHAVLDYVRQQPVPRRSAAHEFVRFCGREDVPPLELERVLTRRKAEPKPYPTHSTDWIFPDGSVVCVWPTGRSLQSPLVQLETRDGTELVQRWWVWWRERWSCRAYTLAPEPQFTFAAPTAFDQDTEAPPPDDAYRILLDGRCVGELVFDHEVRCWFLEAGLLLPPGGGGWLHYATPHSKSDARRLLAQGLLWQRQRAGG